MPTDPEAEALRGASRPLYAALRLLPLHDQKDLLTLAAFARAAREFAEGRPQDRAGFEAFADALWDERRERSGERTIVARFAELSSRANFERSWVDAYLQSIEADFEPVSFFSIEETEHCLYGSAEVLALMAARILELPDKSHPYVQSLARSIGFLGLLRDLPDHEARGSRYLPVSEMKRYGLDGLSEEAARENEGAFRLFIQAQVARCERWRRQAESGYGYLSKRHRTAFDAAARLSAWSSDRIKRDPFVLFGGKLDPPAHVVWRETARSFV